MASLPEPQPEKPCSSSSSSLLFNKTSRLPDDTVFYAIFPDDPSSLQSLHLQILQTLDPFTSDYIWQHEPFSLSLSSSSALVPHLHGKLRFGDNLADEWFVVFLLFEASRNFPKISVKIWDSDGEFLLIEAAYHLPRWLNPENSHNRVFLRAGELHIVARDRLPSPTLDDSLRFLASEEARASEAIQAVLRNRIADYPEKARKDMHRARVRVPLAVAKVLKREPCLISLAVEGFYDRDVDSMKYAARMERFWAEGEENLVMVSVKMSRAMFAQLAGQAFRAPKKYPMPRRAGIGSVSEEEYAEAELGMKITCGFEMAYQQRKKEGSEGKGSSWEVFRDSLERSGYFRGLLSGSQEYERLMTNAEEYYRSTSLFSRASEMMNAPVRRIDEILSLPYSADEFKGEEVPPSDDDSWLYDGEADLNSALSERQKELDLYNAKHKNKQKSKLQRDAGESSNMNVDEFDPSKIAKTMKAFVSQVSSYKGAEVPEDGDMKEVNLDVKRFLKDMESIMNHQDYENIASDDDVEDGSSSDLDFEESGDESDAEEGIEEEKDAFMQSYSYALDEELKTTSLPKSFARAKDQATGQTPQKDQGTSNTTADMDEDFTPVDADVNLVKSLLDSFSSQEGLPGPASNLLGLMGLQLQDPKKGNSK